MQEIERRILTQAEHIRNVSSIFRRLFLSLLICDLRSLTAVLEQQNTVIKAREEKYQSRIKALETLVNGTNEENQV
jgi:hypothetical protein